MYLLPAQLTQREPCRHRNRIVAAVHQLFDNSLFFDHSRNPSRATRRAECRSIAPAVRIFAGKRAELFQPVPVEKAASGSGMSHDDGYSPVQRRSQRLGVAQFRADDADSMLTARVRDQRHLPGRQQVVDRKTAAVSGIHALGIGQPFHRNGSALDTAFCFGDSVAPVGMHRYRRQISAAHGLALGAGERVVVGHIKLLSRKLYVSCFCVDAVMCVDDCRIQCAVGRCGADLAVKQFQISLIQMFRPVRTIDAQHPAHGTEHGRVELAGRHPATGPAVAHSGEMGMHVDHRQRSMADWSFSFHMA